MNANKSILSKLGSLHLVNVELPIQNFQVVGKVEKDEFVIAELKNSNDKNCAQIILQDGSKMFIYATSIRSLVEKADFDKDGIVTGGFGKDGNFIPASLEEIEEEEVTEVL